MKNVFSQEGIIESKLHRGGSRIYILDTDINAKKIFFKMLQYEVCISGFAVKEKHNIRSLYSLPVLGIDEIEDTDCLYIVEKGKISLFQDRLEWENTYYIEQIYFEKNEFVFEEDGKSRKCNAALMIQMILSRVAKRQAIFLIQSDQYKFWNNLVTVLKGEVRDPVLLSIDEDREGLYDLMYYDSDQIVIFVCMFETEDIQKELATIGLKQTYHYVCLYNSFSGHVTDKYYGFDWYLGNSFLAENEMPGFYVYGDTMNARVKVALLGNSATDPVFYPQKSWAEMLWERCRENQVVIYNGAITDYNSTNEMIKLLRDVLLLKPDIVISYSGIIDFREYVPGYPYLNLNLMRTSRKWQNDMGKEVVYGIKDYRSAYERWLNNEKTMYAICQMNDISFWGILQPWIGSERKDAGVGLQVWSDNYWSVAFPQFDQFVNNAREFKEKISGAVEKYEWLHDFTDIFSEIDEADIFYDSIHVNEFGNAIVAEKIGTLFNFFEDR